MLGSVPFRAVLLLAVVKLVIWAISLGSGTSGGVLAPLLMLGSALGALLSPVLPTVSPGFWPLICMGAILAGTMRAPLTAMVFALELTGEMGTLLPLLAAGAAAHGFTVLALRRSILTEKMARRGFHISREYAIDALEILFVRDVMQSTVEALPAAATATEVTALMVSSPGGDRQRLYPALDTTGSLAGVITRRDLEGWLGQEARELDSSRTLAAIVRAAPTVAFADEPLRVVIHRMAETGSDAPAGGRSRGAWPAARPRVAGRHAQGARASSGGGAAPRARAAAAVAGAVRALYRRSPPRGGRAGPGRIRAVERDRNRPLTPLTPPDQEAARREWRRKVLTSDGANAVMHRLARWCSGRAHRF